MLLAITSFTKWFRPERRDARVSSDASLLASSITSRFIRERIDLKPYHFNRPNHWRDFTAHAGKQSHFFDGSGAIIAARSPCHIDVMGDISEYAGGIHMGETVGEYAYVAVQRRMDNQIKLSSLYDLSVGGKGEIVFPVSTIFSEEVIPCPKVTGDALEDMRDDPWVLELVGCLYILTTSGRIRSEAMHGVNILVDCDIELHSEIGASSALKVAFLMALRGIFNIPMYSSEIATVCMKAERFVSGGIGFSKDPMNCILGRSNELLIMKCQPREPLGYLSVPRGWRFVGIDSNARHAVMSSFPTHLLVAEQMGLSIMQSLTGESWGGYLANVSEGKWKEFRDHIPVKMSGEEFCLRHGHIADKRVEINLDRIYNVRPQTEHAINDNDRVKEFIALINLAGNEPDEMLMQETGALMYDSHSSFTDIFEMDCPETDLLVNLARERGPQHGVYGAKISGLGGGKAIVLFQEDKHEETAAWICGEYERITGIHPRIISDTAPGAMELGWLELK